jgi:DNA-binding transcriptional regulator YiaG
MLIRIHSVIKPMTQFAQLLKSEISRLARKEIRSEIQALRRASAQHRSDIAALKRLVAQQQRLIGKLSKPGKRAKETEDEPGQSLRFRASGFASLREKLGLSGAEMARLMNVSLQSIYHWENGKSRPRANQLARIAEIRKMGKRQAQQALER